MVQLMKATGFLMIITILISACTITAQPVSDTDIVNTSVAQTVSAAQGANTPLAVQPDAGSVIVPTITPIPLITLSGPTVTPTTNSCNQAKWVDDVTIPDGSILLPNSAFKKTWRILNVGTCTWNTAYTIIFDSGQATGAPASTPLPLVVPPGGTIDVSVDMTAPSVNGKYTWNFKLRSDTGEIFGFGNGYIWPITAEIEVSTLQIFNKLHFGDALHLLPLETLVYDFADQYCSATWQNGLGNLACPGSASDAQGFVVRNDGATLQDGKVYSGEALFTHPRWVNNGLIKGIYPKVLIEDGYHFKSKIGCAYGGNACDVIFEIVYQVGSNPLQVLDQWIVTYANSPVNIDIDLSTFAGKKVAFTLLVASHGSSGQDWAHWVNPRIVK